MLFVVGVGIGWLQNLLFFKKVDEKGLFLALFLVNFYFPSILMKPCRFYCMISIQNRNIYVCVCVSYVCFVIIIIIII